MSHLDEMLKLSNGANFFYLASPYSHKDRRIRHRRALYAKEYSGLLLEMGVKNFSPIAYCDPIADVFDLPRDADWWWNFNLGFMRSTCGLIVARIEGWQESKGVEMELNWYKDEGAPIFFCTITGEGEMSFDRLVEQR